MKLYYIWDAYCGWCYGFKEPLKKFVSNHPELEVQVISGGLFRNNNPISSYLHIPEANKRISEIFNVTFEEPYQRLLKKGDLILDSNHAAIGFGILKNLIDKDKLIQLMIDLQNAFYQEGQSLSDVKTYINIAKKYELDTELVEKAFLNEIKSGTEHNDIEIARHFNVSVYPTLLLEKEGKFFDLKSFGITVDDLEKNFKNIMIENL